MNPNTARAKGTAWETALVRYFTDRGLASYRLPLSSPKGDIQVNGRDVAVEAKNHRRLDLGAWFKQAAKSASARRVSAYAVLHKRIGVSDPGQSYCTIPIHYFATLLIEQRQLEQLLAEHPNQFKVDL